MDLHTEALCSYWHLKMAAIKVFKVNELLEAILLKLRASKLVQVKAVCKSWKELIDSSPQIQRAMFLLPSDDIVQRLEDQDYGPGHRAIALHSKAFKPLPFFRTRQWDFAEYPKYSPSWEHHIFEHTRVFHATVAPVNHRFYWEINEVKILGVPSAYRDMYLTQPPVSAVTLTLIGLASHCANSTTVMDKRGITIGLIADMVEKALQQLPPPMRQKHRKRLVSPYACVGFRMPEASQEQDGAEG